MSQPQPLSCWTCGTTEPHRPLSEAQKAWLRGAIGEDYVEHYWMCAKPSCRNVRTFMTERRFRQKPVRIPRGID
ncbi:hypothetical protein [Streptomyces spectabilis]|uniref:Uncharacterized protein n=1 Tax=Streptomyces spectabilis TaxID=68270 RepID=A0A516R7D8_STRST|nr:hypothetical protein [Streptomyces spectabilis]QDQ11573.1 hypothetical protein FH965_14150 [Streptomyces spectabilis]